MTGCSWPAIPRLKHKAVMRSNLSSAVAGGEGLFNLSLNGSGVVCIESPCPKEELVDRSPCRTTC